MSVIRASLVSDRQMLMLLGLGVLVLYAGGKYVSWKAGQAVESINPLNDENIFAQASNDLTEKVTGKEGDDLGSAWYRRCERLNFEPWYCPSP